MVMAFQILFVFILAAANAMRTTEPSAVSAGPETSAYNEVVIPKASELFYTGLPHENGISEYVLLRLELVRNHNNRICKCLGPHIIAVKACQGSCVRFYAWKNESVRTFLAADPLTPLQ